MDLIQSRQADLASLGAQWSRVHLQCRRCRGCHFNHWVRKFPWRRVWQPTPVFLPGESQGQRSLAGYCPWGRKESDMTESLTLSERATSPKVTNPEAGMGPHSSSGGNKFMKPWLSCLRLDNSVRPSQFQSPPGDHLKSLSSFNCSSVSLSVQFCFP